MEPALSMTTTENDDLLDYICSMRAAMETARPRVEHPWPTRTVLAVLTRMQETSRRAHGKKNGNKRSALP